MNEKSWKVIAILFIVLFVLETALIVWAVREAVDQEDKEKECILNACASYPSYDYDTYEEICRCYDYQGELQKEVYIGR